MRVQTKMRFVIVAMFLPWTLSAQNSFNSNVIKQIEESERERARMSEADKRLGYFYRIVSLAEKADTSDQCKRQLDMYLDRHGRIQVTFVLRDLSGITELVDEIEALGGVVTASGKYTAFVIGRVFPKSLRQIVKSNHVLRLDPMSEPIHGPYNPNR